MQETGGQAAKKAAGYKRQQVQIQADMTVRQDSQTGKAGRTDRYHRQAPQTGTKVTSLHQWYKMKRQSKMVALNI